LGGAALAGPYGPTELGRPAPTIIPHPAPPFVQTYRQSVPMTSPSMVAPRPHARPGRLGDAAEQIIASLYDAAG